MLRQRWHTSLLVICQPAKSSRSEIRRLWNQTGLSTGEFWFVSVFAFTSYQQKRNSLPPVGFLTITFTICTQNITAHHLLFTIVAIEFVYFLTYLLTVYNSLSFVASSWISVLLGDWTKCGSDVTCQHRVHGIGTSMRHHPESWHCISSRTVLSLLHIYTVNWKKHTKMFFLIYSLQNLADCDKIWYILSWVNLSHRNVNAFCLTWMVSLFYLVKLSIRVLQVYSS